MPPRKRAARHPAVTQTRQKVGSAVANLPEPPSSPLASLNIASYPYILSLILDYSTPSTLSTLLRCSQSTFQFVVGRLYRTLRVTPAQLVNMIEVGWAPSKRGSTSGRLGRSFSYYLRSALDHVRNLHLLEFTSEGEILPLIPRGCLAGVENVVLHLSKHHSIVIVALPQMLRSLTFTHLYVRAHNDSVGESHMFEIRISELPKSVQLVTGLVPLACRLHAAPSMYCPWSWSNGVRTARKASIVMLPWGTGEEELQSTMIDRWSSLYFPIPSRADRNPVSLIGSEYAGTLDDPKLLIGPDRDSGQPVSFGTFTDWFDGMELDTVFSLAEAKSLWHNDMHRNVVIHGDDLGRCEEEATRVADVVASIKKALAMTLTPSVQATQEIHEALLNVEARQLAQRQEGAKLRKRLDKLESRVMGGFLGCGSLSCDGPRGDEEVTRGSRVSL